MVLRGSQMYMWFEMFLEELYQYTTTKAYISGKLMYTWCATGISCETLIIPTFY